MILISAGHNPTAVGACNGDFCEHPEAVKWVNLISAKLNELRVKHEIVPTGSLTKKIRFINDHPGAVIAAEIHFNSNVNARGCETLYHPQSRRGKIAAQIVQRSIASLFPPNRGIKEGWYRQDKPGYVDYPGDVDGDEWLVAFVAKTRCPAIIIEAEFIRNKDIIEANRETACAFIALALVEAQEELQK